MIRYQGAPAFDTRKRRSCDMWQPLRLSLLLCLLLYICCTAIPKVCAAADAAAQCAFADTVNVTGDPIVPGGFYRHGGLTVPTNFVRIYDYVQDAEGKRVPVEPHQRACICALRSCINLCCPWGFQYDLQLGCQKTAEHFQWPKPLLPVWSADGTQKTVNIFQQFAVQHQPPCKVMYFLHPEQHELDEWRLQWDGEILLLHDHIKYDKNKYCLTPTSIDDNSTQYVLNPSVCSVEEEPHIIISKQLNAYAMLFSIPFMLLTIIVYLWLPELRCQLGGSLICHLLCLIIGMSALSYISLGAIDEMSKLCSFLGYICYFAVLGAFFWLSAISFYLWRHACCSSGVVSGQQQRIRFCKYALYAWGLTAVWTLLTWHAEESAAIAHHLRPGIGRDAVCWLDMANWNAMIYFYGPLLLIILTNTIMFVLTARKIRSAHPDKEKFGLFLRLFIVMGLTWSLEILNYLVGSRAAWTKIFYISDLLNALQGLFIFVLFVMRKKVWHLIRARFSRFRADDDTSISDTVHTKDLPADESNAILLKPINAKLDIPF